jgi:hypothetical protein
MEIFPTKLPGESIVTTFNFAPDLGSLTLTGSPTVTVTVAAGVDPDPSAILNGAPQLNAGSTAWLVPVTGGLNGVTYVITVIAPTASSTTVLEIQASMLASY